MLASPSNSFVLMLSGGIDSAVTAFWAKSQGMNISTSVFFDYGQEAAERELHCARRVALACQIPIEVAPIPGLKYLFFGIFDADWHPMMAEGTCPDLAAPYGVAATYAVLRGADALITGNIADDTARHPGIPHFLNSFSDAMSALHDRKFSIDAPLIGKTKEEVISLGATMNVPFENTWACFNGRAHHCGRCPGCQKRQAAFVGSKIADPTIYEP